MAAPAPVTVPLNVSAVVTFSSISTPILPSIVQGPIVLSGVLSGSFPIPTTAGNTVVVQINGLGSSKPSVTAVTLGGSADNFQAGPVAVMNTAITGDFALAGFWIDNKCAGGQTAVAVTAPNLTVITGGFGGITLYEILGNTPLDQQSTNFATVGGTSWTSGTSPITTSPNEIWFGAESGGAPTTPTSPGWINNLYGAGAESGGGYQIVSATGTATYAGTQTNADDWAAAVMTLKGGTTLSGAGTAQIGPRNQRELWYPQVISVSASTAVANALCKTYAGFDTSQPNFVWQTANGSTGDTTANIAGPGLAALNLPGRVIHCNEYMWAIWTGGDGGAQGRLNIQGMKVIGSGGSPGWTHVRTRKLT